MKNLTTVQRIEKGLDRERLMKLNNDLDEATADYRGLIYIEAKKDQKENSSLSWEKYLDGFIVEGKQITKRYADILIKTATAKDELASENFKKVGSTLLKTLNETEAHLQLPTSERTCQSLKGDNAVQLLANWNNVREATGKDVPTSTEVREYNKAKKEAKEKDDAAYKKASKKHRLPKPKVDPFTTEEEIDFETWCIQEHGFDIYKEKPEGSKAIYALKDEKVSVLFGRLDEWKSAYKIMAKLCHPDTGGNTLAMSFLGDFKELMKSLESVKTIIDYETKVDDLREEYSKPKV